jgi:ATP-dependent DNA helicase DinG
MAAATILLPDAPCLVVAYGHAVILSGDGELMTLTIDEARKTLKRVNPPLVIHAPSVQKRLGLALPVLDILELFAFARPAQNCAPTPAGLARALDEPVPTTLEAAASAMQNWVAALLGILLQGRDLPMNRHAAGLAALMGGAGWPWARSVLAALGAPAARPDPAGLKLWSVLPEWEEQAPRPPPTAFPVGTEAARTRLAQMLGTGAEPRPAQADYASAVSAAFAPRDQEGAPHCVLAEAGTGTGKTLGYIAPASLWAEQNDGPVWIATYTRHLQRQIEQELERLEPDPVRRRARVVLRKGRENYLCLLNYEDALGAARASNFIAMGLIARWALLSGDHDVTGGDLPGWFADLFGNSLLPTIVDRRGECIHAACAHWKRCTIEQVVRRARGADLVIANHALVMAQAAWGGLDDSQVPTRYVFDEGHHVFDAADSAFAVELSGAAMAELRRWLLGAEGGRSRARGLARRLDDFCAADDTLVAPLDAVLIAARVLPGEAWLANRRLSESPDGAENPLDQVGTAPAERFLAALDQAARARAASAEPEQKGRIEVDLHPAGDALVSAAATLDRALERLVTPLTVLRQRLIARLDREADTLEERDRQRIEALGRSLARRAIDPITAWRRLLTAVTGPTPEPGDRPARVLFIQRDRDIALLGHLLDPTEAFAELIGAQAHGLVITSATLRDSATPLTGPDAQAAMEAKWRAAEARTGAAHLAAPAIRAAFASPFDYPHQTRVIIVRDIPINHEEALASAYRSLFLAAGGGALGLFTAIARLRAVHRHIAPALEAAGLPLYAQHVDAMNNASLVDVFRAEHNACLLGTDAMRDGVDVPGNALRLVVLERTPWPRPDILHRVRRNFLAGGAPRDYDDAIVRLRLRQAFGRLIRRGDDRGVFVLIDRAAPSRLLNAFPEGVPVQRLGLAAAVAQIRDFFAADSNILGNDL